MLDPEESLQPNSAQYYNYMTYTHTNTTRPLLLLVDDDKRALNSFRRILETDYEVLTAQGADEALRLLGGSPEIKVIISDLKMPGMDGINFLKTAKQMLPDAIRILLTGFADLHNALDAVNEGNVFRLLNKPCSATLLFSTVKDALRQHQLMADSRELHTLKKLKQVVHGIVAGFSKLIETRDPYTAEHQRRVATLSCLIGREMGFTPEQLDALHIAAMLHDIGKAYIPSDFLNKPGELSKEEFAIIYQHPQVGADILKDVDFHWPISEIILQHHERLDGSGYPQGLTGDEILPAAKILAVADVVDAMSSLRPYRAALGLDVALNHLQTDAGKLYDPDAVSVCVDLFRYKGYSLKDMDKDLP